MMNNRPPNQQQLYQRIDEILFYQWDPIGISGSDWPRNEYHSYLPQVFACVMESNSPQPVAKLLGLIATENMGLAATPDHDIEIAKLMIEIKHGLAL